MKLLSEIVNTTSGARTGATEITCAAILHTHLRFSREHDA
jgi:hypothetical protein